MNIEIHTILPKNYSEFAQRIANDIEATQSQPVKLISLLDNLLNDTHHLVDLYDWKNVLIASHNTLLYYMKMTPTLNDLELLKIENSIIIKDVIKSLLKFHIRLVKSVKDKRHYLTFEAIDYLLKSIDMEVVELCLELIFHICVPASSISANVNDDWVDSIEIPSSTALLVSTVFQNLSLKSSDFGVIEYLQGVQRAGPPVLEVSLQTVQHPVKSVQITPTCIYGSDFVAQFCSEHELTAECAWPLVLLERTLAGYVHDICYRESISRMRLFSFFVLIHSRVPPTTLQEFVKSGSSFLRDILLLSDINSEYLVALNLNQPLKIAHICMENVLGLLESQLRRRSAVNLHSNIIELLSLEGNELNSLSGEDPWITIVSSAVSFFAVLCPGNSARNDEVAHLLYFEGGIGMHSHDIGKFVRLGLELFALALTTREPHHVLNDIRVLSIIVGLLKSAVEQLHFIFQFLLGNAVVVGKSHNFVQILYVIAKALYCLELTADRPGYLNAFRECGALEPITKIIDIYSAVGMNLEELFEKYPASCNIMESALSVVHISIQKHRHSQTIGGTQITESGYQLVHNPSFLMLGKHIFKSITQNSDVLWVEYIHVLKEAVDIEPSFLGTFLSSDVAQEMKVAFVNQVPFRADSRVKKVDIERLFIPLLRFLLAICFTNDSRSYIISSGIISFVLDGIHHDCCILPNSGSLSSERIAKVGKLFAQLMIDQDEIKAIVATSLKSKLVELSVNAVNCCHESSDEFSSSRMTVLQKLNNLCILLESVFSENRRQLSDVMKDVISPCVENLVAVYPKTLPHPSQLLAQMSLRVNQNSPHYGFAQCSRSIGSILKLALAQHPQNVVPKVFKEVDDCLGRLSSAQQALKYINSLSQMNIKDEVVLKRQSEGSGGGNSVNVHVVGILDLISSQSLINDVNCKDDPIEQLKYNHVYDLTVSFLNLEWLCSLLVHAFRAIHRSNSNALLTASKDVLRRLFGLFRSSMMEICNYAEAVCGQKDMKTSQNSKGLLDSFGCAEPPSNLEGRVPAEYKLRVIGTDGALIREGIEIDGSRIVFVAELGSVIVASERRVNAAGLIRYLTSHGWISEYRRDSNRTPLVELLDLKGCRVVNPNDKIDELSILLTQREIMCLNMSRLHATLRQVTMLLGKLAGCGNGSDHLAIVTSSVSPYQLGQLFGNIVKGFFDATKLKHSADLKTTTRSVTSDATSSHDRNMGIDNIFSFRGLALYYGAIAKNIILPSSEDKNGNFNIPVLRSFRNHGIIQSFFDSFLLVSRLLHSEVVTALQKEKPLLDSPGVCAVNSMGGMVSVIKRLVDRDAIVKSIPSGGGPLIDEVGYYQLHDFLFELLSTASGVLVQMCEEDLYENFPVEYISDFFDTLLTLCKSLKNPLPAPRELSSDVRTEQRSLRDRLGRFLHREIQQQDDPSADETLTGIGFDRTLMRNILNSSGSADLTPIMEALFTMQPQLLSTSSRLENQPPPPPVESPVQLPNLDSELGRLDNFVPSDADANVASLVNIPSSEVINEERFRSARRSSSKPVKHSDEMDNSNFIVQNEALRTCLDNILTFIPKIAFNVSRNSVKMERWESGQASFRLFHEIKDFCVKMKTEFMSMCNLEVLWRDIYASVLHFTNDPTERDTIYGPLCLFNLSLQDEIMRTNIVAVLGTRQLNDLGESLIRAMGQLFQNVEAPILPKWLESAILFVTQIIGNDHGIDSRSKSSIDSITNFLSERRSKTCHQPICGSPSENDTCCSTSDLKNEFFQSLMSIVVRPNFKYSDSLAQAIVCALVVLLDTPILCDKFIEQRCLFGLLNMKLTQGSENDGAINPAMNLSLILKKCLTTHAEKRDRIWEGVVTIFRNLSSDEKGLPLHQFISGLSKYLVHDPNDFYFICKHRLRFFRVKDSTIENSSQDSSGTHVCMKVLNTNDVPHDKIGCSDDEKVLDSVHLILEVLQQRIVSSVKVDSERHLFSISDLLHCMAENTLMLLRLPPLLGVAINQRTLFLQILIENCILGVDKSSTICFPSDVSLSSTFNGGIAWACARMFLVCSAFSGTLRTLIIEALVNHLLKLVSAGTLGSNPHVAKLCHLILLVTQAHHRDLNSKEIIISKGISVMAVECLFRKFNIMAILFDLIVTTQLELEFGSSTIISALELIELFTRPVLMGHLENHSLIDDKMFINAPHGSDEFHFNLEKRVSNEQAAIVENSDITQESVMHVEPTLDSILDIDNIISSEVGNSFFSTPSRDRNVDGRDYFESTSNQYQSSNSRNAELHNILRGLQDGVEANGLNIPPEFLTTVLRTLRSELIHGLRDNSPERQPQISSPSINLTDVLSATPLISRHPLYDLTTNVRGQPSTQRQAARSTLGDFHPERRTPFLADMNISLEDSDILPSPASWSHRNRQYHGRTMELRSNARNFPMGGNSDQPELDRDQIRSLESVFQQLLEDDVVEVAVESNQSVLNQNPTDDGSVYNGSIPTVEIDSNANNEYDVDLTESQDSMLLSPQNVDEIGAFVVPSRADDVGILEYGVTSIIATDENVLHQSDISNEGISVSTVPNDEAVLLNERLELSPSLEYRGDILTNEQLSIDDAVNMTESSDVAESLAAMEERNVTSVTSTTELLCPPGYDEDVFNSLPPEMQLEVIEQHSETADNMRELIAVSGFDYETIMSLPDDIRQEVLDQARRQISGTSIQVIGATAGGSGTNLGDSVVQHEIDNVTFLATLPLELRSEVLLTADPQFLSTLPADVVAEAQALRERAASNWQREEILHTVRPIASGGDVRTTRNSMNPTEQEEEPYDSDENSEENDDPSADELFMPPRRRTVPEDSATPVNGDNLIVANGLMKVLKPKDLKLNFCPLFGALSKLLTCNFRLPGQFTELMIRIALNVSSVKSLNDILARIVIGILANSQHVLESLQNYFNSPIISYANLEKRIPNFENCGTIVLYRLLYLTTHLSTMSNTFVLSLLYDRSPSFEVIDGSTSGRGESSHSLLEQLFVLFGKFVRQSRIKELEMLVCLIDSLTKPLEHFVENSAMPDDNDSETHIFVKIPSVRLSRNSLTAFCDILLSDNCTSRIFNNVTTCIRRFSMIKTNAFILQDVMRAILLDVSQIATHKLNSLVNYLKSVSLTSPGSKDLSSTSANAAVIILPSIIPWGEFSCNHYEKLNRLTNALRSMDEGNCHHHGMQSFALLVDDLHEVWSALDEAFGALKLFHDDESQESTGTNSGSVNPQQTTMLSILRRLLPILDCFMMVHTVELKEQLKGIVNEASEMKTVALTTSTGEAMLQLPPGYRFRITVEYLRANISFTLPDNDTSAISPSSTTACVPNLASALRRQVSFGGTSSIPRVSSALTNKSQSLLAFVQSHRSLINLLIKSHPNLLLDENFSALMKVVQLRHCVNFENKRKFFQHQLKRLQQTQSHRRSLSLQIRRNQVFEDSFHQLRSRRAEDLRGRLQVSFYGEEGIDAGGLTREWYMILAREIFNPNYALFMAAADGATFQPNPLSIINSNHLDYFKFVGRVIGKAVCDGQLMDAHFTRSFYKHVLGMPVDFSDIESTEPDYFKSLRMMLDHPLDILGFTGLTFTAEIQKFGRTEDVELIPNGSRIAVTDDNKHDYVRLVAHHRMTTGISSQIDSFLSGFYDLVPPELICIFSPTELELLICGLPDVNVDELKLHTEYNQYRPTDENIVWFWQALRSFNREERAAFLQFITGTSKVPLGGFANLQGMRGNQKFSIHKSFGGETGKLPSAHTCYNQLDLPVYSSPEELREKLLTAIKEGSEGFGFA